MQIPKKEMQNEIETYDGEFVKVDVATLLALVRVSFANIPKKVHFLFDFGLLV